jgi:glycosyltransferase involved in cell wall biosynthesis
MKINKKIFLPLNSLDENRISSEKYYGFIKSIEGFDFSDERFKINPNLNKIKFITTELKIKLTKYFLSNRIYNNKNFDIVHILEQSNLYLVKHFQTKKIFATIHDIIPVLAYGNKINGFSYPNNPFFFKYNLKQLNNVNKIIAVSNKTKLDLCDYFQNDKLDINVIHNPVNPIIKKISSDKLNKFYDINNINSESDKILIVGLSKIKNVSFALKIFKKLLSSFPKIELHLVGSVSNLNQDDNIFIQKQPNNIFTHQDVDDIRLSYLYSMSKILLFPSYYEGFGLPLIEAMTCGSVVVASDRGSIPEIVGNAGFTLSLDDVDIFVNCIIKLLTNEDFFEHYKSMGYQRASFFSIENFINKYSRLYNE